MLDQLLLSLHDVCEALLPVAGVIVLIYLAIFFKRLISLLKQTENLVNDINTKVEKLEKPLNTVNDLCDTVDNVHHATVSGVNGAIEYIIHNFSQIVGAIKEYIEARKNKTDITFENEPESTNSEGE